MFGLKITYLRGSVTAADIRTGQDKSAVEWPPHPDRLFCALVQAWGDLGEPQQGLDALRWFEEQSPPHIYCGNILDADNHIRFVPDNDNIKQFIKGSKVTFAQNIQGTGIGRFRHGRLIPHAPLSDDRVFFYWPDLSPDPEILAALKDLAGAISNLGHSSSFVNVEVVDKPDELEQHWLPQPSGEIALRIPYSGRLEELRSAYSSTPRRRSPLSVSWVNYGKQEKPQAEAQVDYGQHKSLFIFSLLGENPPLPIECAGTVIDVWRKAIISRADQPPLGILTGHAPDSTPENPKPLKGPYMAMVPLADVGHRYARSHLLGVAAALPVGISEEERKVCLRALAQVDELNLGRLGKWHLALCDASETRKALKASTWSKPSHIWGSVTPFVFGKYPKDPWGEDAEDLVSEACLMAGLPEPIEVAVAPISWVLGVPPSFRFPPLPQGKGRPRRFHAHVRLVFQTPITGPVLVGAGRHRGYGLFRQLSEDKE